MKRALLLLACACGPAASVEADYFTATLGEPCPGFGRSACDPAAKSTVHCNTDDGGVWEFAHYGCSTVSVTSETP